MLSAQQFLEASGQPLMHDPFLMEDVKYNVGAAAYGYEEVVDRVRKEDASPFTDLASYPSDFGEGSHGGGFTVPHSPHYGRRAGTPAQRAPTTYGLGPERGSRVGGFGLPETPDRKTMFNIMAQIRQVVPGLEGATWQEALNKTANYCRKERRRVERKAAKVEAQGLERDLLELSTREVQQRIESLQALVPRLAGGQELGVMDLPNPAACANTWMEWTGAEPLIGMGSARYIAEARGEYFVGACDELAIVVVCEHLNAARRSEPAAMTAITAFLDDVNKLRTAGGEGTLWDMYRQATAPHAMQARGRDECLEQLVGEFARYVARATQ